MDQRPGTCKGAHLKNCLGISVDANVHMANGRNIMDTVVTQGGVMHSATGGMMLRPHPEVRNAAPGQAAWPAAGLLAHNCMAACHQPFPHRQHGYDASSPLYADSCTCRAMSRWSGLHLRCT